MFKCTSNKPGRIKEKTAAKKTNFTLAAAAFNFATAVLKLICIILQVGH